MNNFSLIKTKAYINGQFVNAQTQHTFSVFNPATGEEICQVADTTTEDALVAIQAAQTAQRTWQQHTPKERAYLLRQWFHLIMEHQEQLAQILSLEQGKPLAESRGEIVYGASFVEWFAEEAKRISGDVLPQDRKDHRLLVLKQPVGVVAAITPWNFPHAMITRKTAPALAAGCAVVLKPAPETPLSALALAELAHQAGIPKGVFNVLPSTDATGLGKIFSESPIVRKLTFTGSTRVGKLLMAQCANTVKKLSLELGGNAPAIIFDDAELDHAVEQVFSSKFRNSGQTCVCVNRIYVQANVYEQFIEKLLKKVKQIQVGAASQKETTLGPLISERAVQKIQTHIADAICKTPRLFT